MTHIKFNLILILTLFISFNTVAKEPFERKIHKEFIVNSNSKLVIENKFGSLNIMDWDKNKVSIDVAITVIAKNRDKAESIFNMIKVTLEEKGDIISAITKIDGAIKNVDFTINYVIKMPKHLPLDLSNKFGSVFINKLTGNTILNVSYGNLHVTDLLLDKAASKGAVSVSYGNADIKYCTNTSFTVKYSTLEIEGSEDISIISRFSTVIGGNIKSFIIDSKYDNIEIQNINSLTLFSKFSNAEISSLRSILELDLEYGNFEVDHITKNFSDINIKNKFGDIEISFGENVSYLLDVVTEYSDLDFPENKNLVLKKEGNRKEVKGSIGSNPKSKVNITSKYGSVELN